MGCSHERKRNPLLRVALLLAVACIGAPALGAGPEPARSPAGGAAGPLTSNPSTPSGSTGPARALAGVAPAPAKTGRATAPPGAPQPPTESGRATAPHGAPQPPTESGRATAPPGAKPAPAKSDPAALLFSQKCAGCHTIGRGQLTGPDLAIAPTRAPAVLATNIKKMEDRVGPLAADQVGSLVALLRDAKAAARVQAAEDAALQSTVKLDPPSAAAGRRLFEGRAVLQNGGMACASCHQVAGRGGSMARDLTDVQKRMGTAALVTAVEQPSFPIMRNTYRIHPVTRQEAVHLAKFLETQAARPAVPSSSPVPLFGGAGAFLFLAGMGLFYRNRNTGVRARLLRGHREGAGR